MNSILRMAALSIVVAVSGSMAAAQDFDKGMSAYQAGDYATALAEWRPLAGQGDFGAQINLGNMYNNGEGVLQDYTEAARLYRLAAEQGYAMGQARLGLHYQYGKGVLKDPITANMWYNIASANGDQNTGTWRDEIEGKMTPEQIAEATRRAKVCMSSGYQDCD